MSVSHPRRSGPFADGEPSRSAFAAAFVLVETGVKKGAPGFQPSLERRVVTSAAKKLGDVRDSMMREGLSAPRGGGVVCLKGLRTICGDLCCHFVI